MEVVCSSEQSTDKMSDDPEVSVAIEQSSPPPETDERKLSNKVKMN